MWAHVRKNTVMVVKIAHTHRVAGEDAARPAIVGVHVRAGYRVFVIVKLYLDTREVVMVWSGHENGKFRIGNQNPEMQRWGTMEKR